MEKEASMSRKALEVLSGFGQGVIEHSFIFPTALRKDFTMKAKPEDIKLSEKHSVNAHQVGYFLSLYGGEVGWILPLCLNYAMYNGAANIDPQLPKALMWTQIGLNVGSAIYEIGRSIIKSNAKVSERVELR